MKGLPKFPKKYFEKFNTKPVKINSFDPRSKKIATDYLKKLEKLLKGLDFKILHRGSTAFGIAGKGDIEIGVYPTNRDWDKVLKRLESHFGEAGNLEENYARFNDQVDGCEVEVILLRGYEAVVDQKMTQFLKNNPKLLDEYETLKKQFSFSKREYQIQKDKFLRKVIRMIPG